MKKLLWIVLLMFLAIGTSSKVLKADDSGFESALLKLCKTHYLFDDILLDTSGSNHLSIWLKAKVWNNPIDTRKLVDSIKKLAKTSALSEFKISVFGKPSLSNRIALITVRPKGVVLDYTYIEAKQKSLPFKKSSWKRVSVLTVRGQRIYEGLHADSVFKVLTQTDRISESDVKNDGTGSLVVTHHWKVDNQFIDITFRRSDGMYRVHSIRKRLSNKTLKQQKQPQKKSNGNIATRPKSCYIYGDCKMYGGCNNFSNCYGACLNDCKRNGCPLCK